MVERSERKRLQTLRELPLQSARGRRTIVCVASRWRSMVNYRRNLVPGGTFFFTVALVDRRSDRLTSHIAALGDAFRKAQAERPFAVDAIVVLPDHLHSIFPLPPGDADFSHRWRRIKTVFTERLRRDGIDLPARDSAGFALWQRRFWEHTVRDAADYARHVDYIHNNPAKHGYVTNPGDWPYSSLHRFIRQGILADGWGGSGDADRSFGEPDDG
jgi:putative transposase